METVLLGDATSCVRAVCVRCTAASACRFPHGIYGWGSMMEGAALPAVPRLAKAFYQHYCWPASDPHQTQEGQVVSTADNSDLQSETDSDPHLEGQAKTNNSADNVDLQSDSADSASDPQIKGQAKTADNGDLHFPGDGASAKTASDPHIEDGQASLEAENNLHFSTASDPHSEGQASVKPASDPQQAGQASAFRASDPREEGQANKGTKLHPAINLCSSANPATSPSRQHRLHEATLKHSPLASRSSTIPAIPVLLSLHAASPLSQWRDEVLTTSSATNTSSTFGGFSQLRANASPWNPNKPPLPSLLVGDIPILPMSSSPKLSHPLLLPIPARQTLAPYPLVETLGVGQPFSCPFCGHSLLHPPGGSPTSTVILGFSHLRGRIRADQVQESKVAVHHHGFDPARHSTRLRCKMKSELKGLRIHKATLDPG